MAPVVGIGVEERGDAEDSEVGGEDQRGEDEEHGFAGEIAPKEVEDLRGPVWNVQQVEWGGERIWRGDGRRTRRSAGML